ncbi:MAG: hypothetical protein AAF628_09435 [Planctomycetota bacterium]
MTGTEFGVMYFADANRRYREMLDVSIASLRRQHPDWSVRVETIPSFGVSPLRALYRAVSFWKRARRFDRAGQDRRVIAAKTDAWHRTPFDWTLFLDADTFVLRSLAEHAANPGDADVITCRLGNSKYRGVEPWHPAEFPYLMSGVVFFGPRFLRRYREVAGRMATPVARLPTGDQYVFSLTCALFAEELRVVEDPKLQIDVINMEHHLGTADLPMRGPCIDLREPRLREFGVFHYNEYKPQYLAQIREVWGT